MDVVTDIVIDRPGFSTWWAPFMAMAVRRANQKDLVLLKQRVEEGRRT